MRLDGSARIPQCTNLCIENLLIAQPVRACADFQVPTGSSFTQCSGPSDVRVCVVERVRACVNHWGSEKVPRRVRKSQVAVSPSRYESRAVLRSDRSDPKLIHFASKVRIWVKNGGPGAQRPSKVRIYCIFASKLRIWFKNGGVRRGKC